MAFADDATVIIGAQNRKEIIEKGDAVTTKLDEWALRSTMIFSPTKCHFMFMRGSMDTGSLKITLSGTKVKFTLAVSCRLLTQTGRPCSTQSWLPVKRMP